MIITIKERDVDIKFNFRAEMIFEEVRGHTFNGQNTTEWLMYFYATIIANTQDGFIGFEEYVNWLSDHAEYLYDFIEYYTEINRNIVELRKKKKEQQEKKATRKKGLKGKSTAGSATTSA